MTDNATPSPLPPSPGTPGKGRGEGSAPQASDPTGPSPARAAGVPPASSSPSSILHPPSSPSPPPRIIIVGAGLAGMAAAVALESAGLPVTLLEARRTLGGRAGSYEDPQTGQSLDNCQHVLLGCCTNLLDFYHRIGATHKIRFEPAIRFLDDHGRPHSLSPTPHLPAPLHLAPAGLRFNLLSLPERLQLARASLAMMRLGRAGRQKLADLPFGQWLDDHHQSPSLVRKLYEPVLIGALNESVRAASAEFAIQVFQDALLSHSAGCRLGIPATTLGDLYSSLPLRDLRLSTRVTSLTTDSTRVTGVLLSSGQTLPADAVILATNHHAISKWIPDEWLARDTRFHHLDKLESVPILGTHLWFDRPVLRASHAALLSSPLQWVFRKDPEGRCIHGVISAARDYTDLPREELLASFTHQLRTTLPGAANAKLLRGTTVIEKRATFAALPGVNHYRPPQAPPPNGLPNLYLAGDYTLTGWPATMEGAVRSGYLAAQALCPTHTFLLPDLPPQWPARLLGLRAS